MTTQPPLFPLPPAVPRRMRRRMEQRYGTAQPQSVADWWEQED